MTAVLILTFIVSMLLKVPIAFALGVSVVIAIITMTDLSLSTLVQLTVRFLVESTVLICVPLFILAGNIMAFGGLGLRIVRLANIFVGRARGGLSSVSIIASMFFGGISGSAAADASAIGSVLIPAMQKEGYDRDFSTAVTVIASPLGNIIPPSIPMIVYCSVVGESVAALFAAGYFPGILYGLFLILTGWIISVFRGYPRASRYSFYEIIKISLENIPAILFPIVIVGGIIAGIFTPTEAAGISVIYAFFVSKFWYKELRWEDMPHILNETAKLTGNVMLIISLATAFGWVLAFDRAPFRIAEFVAVIISGKELFLIAYILLLIILGCFLTPSEIIIIIAPLFYPLALKMGLHPLHFGIITISCVALGQATPPVGFTLFVGAAISGAPIERVTRALIPFYIASVSVILVMAFVPEISLFIPRVLGLI